MFKFILVPATGTQTDEVVFKAALAIVRRSAGHLKFLHVQPNVQTIMATMATSDLSGGAGYDQIIGSLENDVAERRTKAEAAFRAFCEREEIRISSDPHSKAPSAEWMAETGDEAMCVAEHGRAADLIVIGRAREGEPGTRAVIEAALMHTGRPVLIVPNVVPDRIVGTVAIAWKNGPESARAVAAAQPFVEMAERVIILSVEEDVDIDAHACERLRQALLWHNLNTTVQPLEQDSRSDADILLAATSDMGADMLVMGGYGHSRMREVIFGGVTRRVLSGADVPVFITH